MEKIGKYKILGILGKGGMGIVYKALDPDIEREVAIKTIRFDTLSAGTHKDELMGRFIREARAAGKIAHPNIITVFDVGRENDLTYIVMQYIEGQSLQALIDSGKRLSPKEIVEVMKPICDALDYAHNSGIIHRDIKPANIMIDKSGKSFLADFGVARMETSTMTQSGTTVGTLIYMSPEQITGQKVDRRSDIFSLGIVLYELLAGKMPFCGDNISSIVYKIVNEHPTRITEINKDVPPGYDRVVHKTLAKNPDDRYQNCRELAAGLDNAEQILEQTLAYETDKEQPPPAGAKKKTALVLVFSFLGVVLAAGGAYFIFAPKSAKPAKAVQSAPVEKKEVLPPVTSSIPRSEKPASTTVPPSDNGLIKVKESFDNKRYDETIKLAEDLLAKDPANPSAKDYRQRAKKENLAAQIAPLLQTGISSYNKGSYDQCLQDMERVLNLDKENNEAQKYLFLADTALSKIEILALIERRRTAQENKDLLTFLSDIDSPALASEWQSEYKNFFNWYDEIKFLISNISVDFPSRSEASTSFSYLLTAVYKKDGKRNAWEGNYNWQFRKRGNAWKLTAAGK